MHSTIDPPPHTRTDAVNTADVDAHALEQALAENLEGEVRFGHGDRAMYATDGSNYRQVPIGVVIPRSYDDVEKTIAIARGFGAPVLNRGGGTSLAGECCNAAVVLDFSKYLNRVLEIDAENRRARVQPGTILDTLRDAAKRQKLTFGPDPATHNHCTLGGMLGNDSCGIHSVMAAQYGPGARVADNTEELEILTYDGVRMRVGPTSEEELERIIREGGRKGEIYGQLRDLRDRYADQIRSRYPDIPRRVSGYNLPQLLPEHGFNVARALVGSESTCVTILEATVTLIPEPEARSLLVLGYPDVYSAGAHVPEVMAHKPIGCEGMDDKLIGYMKKKGMHPKDVKLLPEGNGWLLVEFGGDSKEDADAQAHELMEELRNKEDAPTMKLFDDMDEETQIWEVRESGLGATAFVPGERPAWPGWEDSAVPPARVGDYLRDLRGLFDKYDYHAALYGHFGQGCIHCRIDFDLTTREGIDNYKHFTDEAAELVTRYGGSLSGEHGDGQSRGPLLPVMFGDEITQAFREFKQIWDPQWKMNPGKVVDAYRRDENLRLGVNYEPAHPATHFKFPEDHGSFAHATLRCVGVGKCRRLDGGDPLKEGDTMCPSFMVTREEKDTTRGRAHLLFEMLGGEVMHEGWRSEPVKEALDLCLACKGCKHDCPVNVDMATYKAEFLSHYYHHRLRPRAGYAFGWIQYWARLVETMPDVVNLFTQTPGLARAAKWAAGMAPQRHIPRFAPRTFKQWFRARPVVNAGKPRVMLWPDTFNNHLHPATLQAAVEVLEHAGCQVVVPEQWLCCGRPLYDYGMLDLAERQLRGILDALRPEIAAGTPLVGLEPSCTAVFRDELVNIFPNDADAKRLNAQTFTLAEFLMEQTDGYQPPRLQRKATVHGHCHHKAIMGIGAEAKLLDAMGLDYNLLQSGCCGMAGAFGFEKEHYDVSIACGERVLLPAVREAADDTLLIADGFSCREQVRQTTDRFPLHLAEVLQLALHGERLDGKRPEIVQQREFAAPSLSRAPSPLLGAAALGGALILGRAAVRGVQGALRD